MTPRDRVMAALRRFEERQKQQRPKQPKPKEEQCDNPKHGKTSNDE